METETAFRRYVPVLLWAAALLAAYFLVIRFLTPYTEHVSLNQEIIVKSATEIGRFVLLVLGAIALVEGYVYLAFFRKPRSAAMAILMRLFQGLVGAVTLMMLVVFFSDIGGLFELGEGPVGAFFRWPFTQFTALTKGLAANPSVGKAGVPLSAAAFVAIAVALLYLAIYLLSEPRPSQLGLAYLLIMPALIGVSFLIIYPFLFEIRLAFSNMALGTAKNPSFGLEYGWENLVTLFTGNVAKEAKFFEVFLRTVIWTVINVTFHVTGGMALALLLNRPMKLKGIYRTLLVFPWAIPGVIAAMALRNEFDSRYGLFNILLTDIHAFVVSLGPAFSWLSFIGPVSWKQDPFWAFVSVLMANIWLGIPFMMVFVLGGLQSISQEYYEAAEIDGASKVQQFRNITLPLLRPVLTPAIVLGTVWTFNKFEAIYLITQGGPQEKTDILVSSMYKAAFQFYRYGFTAMFALVIFAILLVFSLIFIRASGGLKTVYE